MNNLGFMYAKGLSVSQDYGAAFASWKKVAEGGNVTAISNIGCVYYLGLGEAEDDQEAVVWWTRAAEKEDVKAMYDLGVIHLLGGSGVEKDSTTAVHWLRKSASGGNEDAKSLLVSVLAGSEDPSSVTISGSDAARPGNDKLAHGLVLIAFNANDQAMKAFEEAAAEGNAAAMCKLGDMYRLGVGVLANSAVAVKWYQKAADAGEPHAMILLANALENGDGAAMDSKRATQWLERAAACGNAIAMDDLGEVYERGAGVTQDEAKVIDWYHKAAIAGYAPAVVSLAKLIGNVGYVKDGIAQLKKAANAGDADAAAALSTIYASGLGVPKDEPASVQWLERSANLGNKDSMFQMGIAYFRGTFGVVENRKAGKNWLQRAAALGNAQAAQALAQIQQYSSSPADTSSISP